METSQLTNQALNEALHTLLGKSPTLENWWAWKDTPEGERICMEAPTKKEVEDWLKNLPEGSWAKDYQPKAFYRYPNYTSTPKLLEEIQANLSDHAWKTYMNFLCKLIPINPNVDKWQIARALLSTSTRQRAEALYLTLTSPF